MHIETIKDTREKESKHCIDMSDKWTLNNIEQEQHDPHFGSKLRMIERKGKKRKDRLKTA